MAMTTFGIKMNISHLGSNIYMSFTITVIADTLGTLLMFTMDRVGHKRLLVISVLSTGAACAVSFILILFVDNGKTIEKNVTLRYWGYYKNRYYAFAVFMLVSETLCTR